MTLQGPHQVAKQSRTMREPFSARALSKSALLLDKRWSAHVTYILYGKCLFQSLALTAQTAQGVRYSRLEVVDAGLAHFGSCKGSGGGGVEEGSVNRNSGGLSCGAGDCRCEYASP